MLKQGIVKIKAKLAQLRPDQTYALVLAMLCSHAAWSMQDMAAQVQLVEIASKFPQVTDIQAVPSLAPLMVILQKGGDAFLLDHVTKRRQDWLRVPVLTASEQGLLGIAFHPQFQQNGQFVMHYSVAEAGQAWGQIALWRIALPQHRTGNEWIWQSKPELDRVIMRVAQPYGNHKGGQVTFGPDGYLYIGFGDGGSAGDPLDHGQNPRSLLGSMLRIDLQVKGKPYAIPADNPFADGKLGAPEVFAYGLRNPWRFSFDQSKRLWVADVGQNMWEEISQVEKGGNYGWNIMEGAHCFKPKRDCAKTNLQLPVYEYSHSEGSSITGGYEYMGTKLPWLHGKWVFADFIAGWIRAMNLRMVSRSPEIIGLGTYDMLISTFGRTHEGELLVADFRGGKIYMLDEKK